MAGGDVLDRTISKVLEWGFILYKVRDMIISNIKEILRKRSDVEMVTRKSDFRSGRKMRRSLNGRILRKTTLNILMVVAVSLRDYGAFHAVSCEQYFAGQPAAHG